MFRNGIVFVIFALFPLMVFGQQITFKAQASKTEVSVNERFVVQFLLTYGQENINVDRSMKLPDFGELHQLGESQINSFQFSNGNAVNQNGVEIILIADREGEYTIKPATIVLNGKQYKTEAIKISVKQGLKPQIPSGQHLQGAFLTAEVSEKNPFLNQEVVLVVKVFARDYSILNRMRNYQEPDFNDLVVKSVSEKVNDHEKQVLINGNTFISREIARYILFPQKAGEITIQPFAVDVLISGYYAAETHLLSTDPISLRVKNLPGGKPKNFSGAVGNYTMNASLSKNEVKANQSINLEVEIIGSGNLSTLKMPTVNVPKEIEVYAPKKREAFEARPTGLKGKLVENQILVPQYGGDYKIGPIEFNFFNPESEKYVNLETKPFILKVDGPKPPKKDSVIQQEDLGDQIATSDSTSMLKTILPTERMTKVKDQMVESVSNNNNWIWAVLALTGVIIVGFLFKNKRREKEEVQKLNPKQVEKQFISTTKEKMNSLKNLAQKKDNSGFLSLQEEILTEIGMHYSGTNLSDFTEDGVANKLRPSVGNLADEWKKLLLDCKQSKYAFGDSDSNLAEKFKATSSVWKSFQKHATV